MSFRKSSFITLLIIYTLVLIVNVSANYDLYKQNRYWQFSIPFSLSVATLGWLGYKALHHLFLKKNFKVKKQPNIALLLSVIISGLYGLVFMILAMKSLVWFFHRAESSLFNYTNNAIYAALFAMLMALMVNGHGFLEQLKSSAEENERMKKEVLQSQYEALKNQVNPHFFFNALNTLTTLIPEHPDIAVSFVQQLSKVFRYSLQAGLEHTVELATELKVVQAYLFLNKRRYDDKLVTTVLIDEAVLRLHIVPHALLMLVENSIKHNEISTAYALTIAIYNENDLYLVVSNTLQPRKHNEPFTGIGLNNITSRYQLLTEQPVIIERTDKFTVKLPLLLNI